MRCGQVNLFMPDHHHEILASGEEIGGRGE
jgi:hypothetical protein